MLMVLCSKLWIFPENHLKAAQAPEVTGYRPVASGLPRCLALPFSGRATCILALQPAQEHGHFWLAAVLSPASADPLAAVFFCVLFPSLIFVPQVSCYSSSQEWGLGIGVVRFLALAQIPAHRALVWPPLE